MKFDKDFIKTQAFEAKIRVRLMQPEQCTLMTALDQIGNQALDNSLLITLDQDVIKSGGEWISSVDLEDVLLQHDAVAEIAVIAIDDPRWQERPLAIVRGKPGYDADNMFENLRRFLVGKVAKFWVPEYWAFLDDIPKTSVGKMDKKLLREELAAGKLAIQKHLGFGEGND